MKCIRRLLYNTYYEEHRQSLRKLFERSYGRRVWIIQEVVIGACSDSPMLCCGEQGTALRYIFQLVSGIQYALGGKGDRSPAPMQLQLASRLILGLGEHIEEHSKEYPGFREADILQSLTRYQRNLCLDPRDKIYGFSRRYACQA
jgi:hypothetical protein